MVTCGYCNHPGFHAQLIPSGAELSRWCLDCPRCRQDLDQRAEGKHGG